jgi:hypothetical protein
MAQKVSERLARQATESFVGRTEELADLLRVLEHDHHVVVHVHGIAGIGKSSLKEAFARRVRAQGASAICLDCSALEPSARGFLSQLGSAVGIIADSLEDVSKRLRHLGDPVVLALDTYERFRMLDTWMRQVFVPGLHDNVRVVFFGREPPVSAWRIVPGWQDLFRSVNLGPLSEPEARELLLHAGIGSEDADRVIRFARGHPLLLKLAAAAIAEQPNIRFEEVASQQVMAEVTRLHLADIRDPLTREALDAASMVRRTTCALLNAMLPHAAPQDVFDRLQVLFFFENASDGLVMHDAVQQAVASSLAAADPGRRRTYRLAAWQHLRRELRRATKGELWRYSADLLYLIEKPIVREAFFPSNLQPYAIEIAKPKDSFAILAINKRHEGSRGARIMNNWWARYPQGFHVVKDRNGAVVGYYLLLEYGEVDTAFVRDDPVARRLWQHLADDPIPKKQKAIFARRWLDADTGEAFPSAAVSACFLDIKGYYVAMKPWLRRLYCTRTDYETYAPLFQSLRFKSLSEYAIELDGQKYHTDVLDFGPGLFEGWLTNLGGDELGVEEEDVLDEEACELVVESERVSLTPLEYGVMRYLQQHKGEVVRRVALIEDVWGYDSYAGGSNVVDAKIRSLRKKLGVYAPMIETVTGMGYRFSRG